MLRAIEFFSGIGAFSQAARNSSVAVIAAFDQSEAANETFALNYQLRPKSKNLDSISEQEIESADIWWMSPPCTPFSVRGKQLDQHDARAKSFLNLIEKIPKKMPQAILIENVAAFQQSQVHAFLRHCLIKCGYHLNEVSMCSTQFGVPMRRRRYFMIASSKPFVLIDPEPIPTSSVSSFLQESLTELILDDQIINKYRDGFDIVSEDDLNGTLICFTKEYARCMKASGTILRMRDNRLRRISPSEILGLLGFQNNFVFPPRIELPTQWKLVGNSVDVRAIKHLLKQVTAVVDCGEG